MLFSTVGQLPVFLWMIAAGFLIGAWYAVLAAVRRLLQAGFWLSLISDAAFGAGAAVIFMAFLITANHGSMRLFTLAGAAVGMGLFALGAFPPLNALVCGLGRLLCRGYCALKQKRWINVIFR